MKYKKQIRQKTLALAVTSVMSANFMIKNDSAFAMKSIVKGVKSLATGTTTSQIAEIMYSKTHCIPMSASDQQKLNNNLDKIKINNAQVKIKRSNIEKPVNPLVERLKTYTLSSDNYKKYSKMEFADYLKWLNANFPLSLDETFELDQKDQISPIIYVMKEIKDPNLATEICKQLLIYKPDLNKKYKIRYKDTTNTKLKKGVFRKVTALEYAQIKGLYEVVKEMLNAKGDKQYLLYEAISSGNIQNIEKAISDGANIHKMVYGENGVKISPVTLAVKHNNVASLDYLLNKGAKIYDSALKTSLINRSSATFDFLIEHGAKLAQDSSAIELIFKEYSNNNASNFYMDNNNVEFLKKIFTCQKLPLIWKDDYAKSFCFNSPKIWLNPILRKAYIDCGFKIPKDALYNIVNENETTTNDIEFLLNNGINIDDTPEYFHTNSLCLACEKGKVELAKLFISKDPKIDSHTIYYAIRSLVCSHIKSSVWADFIEFLVDKIPKEDLKDLLHGQEHSFDNNALFFEWNFSQEEESHILNTVDFLIKNGMTTNSVNSKGYTLVQNVDERICRGNYLNSLGRKLYDRFNK